MTGGPACDWAACDTTQRLTFEDGWWHCRPHLREHREQMGTQQQTPRPDRGVMIRLIDCLPGLIEDGLSDVEIAQQFNVARSTVHTYRRRLGLVTLAPPALRVGLQPCGTHSAFNRHKAAGEDPHLMCPACVAGESDYQAEQWQKKKQRRQVAA
jgi:hypothetical protein